jgi:hypothetical protein
MSEVSERMRAFLTDAPHWVDLLAAVPARHVLRHDTDHPVFHGCVDWHSACHGVWALIAHRGLTRDTAYVSLVDSLLTPAGLVREAADLDRRPTFEMPYGRAWFLRLALEDRLINGSGRLSPMARDVAASIVAYYRENLSDPFAREYANASWALCNLFDYAMADEDRGAAEFVCNTSSRMVGQIKHLPSAMEEAGWADFMAVTPNFAELLVRTGAVEGAELMKSMGPRLLSLRPVTAPLRSHHHALNFSRAWSLLALSEATGDDRLLMLALDHMQQALARPSSWRGDYRAVAHWVPQFGIFALQRFMRHRAPKDGANSATCVSVS